ncbi:MAG: DUF5664 domain-containing protein [Novosphingobium sp.]|nr:DUF5664 domain-containing protein [Novosphingobium sp.]
MSNDVTPKCTCDFDGCSYCPPPKYAYVPGDELVESGYPACPIHGWINNDPNTTLQLVENNKQKSKDGNPKDAVGTRKVPFSTVSSRVTAEVGLAMLEGARKYGRHNYRKVGVRGSVYYDACQRHLTSWWEGENIDPDSGLNHIIKAIACLYVLRDSMLMENWTDDRPPKTKTGWIQELNKLASDIIDNYPNAKDPYTEI